ncbi:MAG: hypothetical protein J6M66_10315 [Lachnospiraceae bacterium]|nr:hypothetical protein [Lachnospiraceae bacterium]
MKHALGKKYRKNVVLCGAALAFAMGMSGCAGKGGDLSTASVDTSADALTDVTADVSVDSPAASGLTIEALIKANRGDVLYPKYGSVLITHEVIGSEDKTIHYLSEDYFYEEGEGYSFLADGEDNWEYTANNTQGKKAMAYKWYVMDEAEKAERMILPSDYSDPVVDQIHTSKEKIQEIKDNGDGTLSVTTVLSADDMNKLDGTDFYTEDLGYEYVVNRDTLEIVSCDYAVTGDGGETYSLHYTVSHGAAQPENMKTMLDFIKQYESEAAQETRTITVVYDAGTDKEQTYQLEADQRYFISPILRTGYDHLYDNADKTTPYAGGDGVHDCTIYAFSEE